MSNQAQPNARAAMPVGVYVIAAVFALGSLASFSLVAIGNHNTQTFGALAGVLCAFLAHGLATRKNIVRILTVGLLGLSLVASALVVLYLLGGIVGLVQVSGNARPTSAVASQVLNLAITLWMFGYLRRDDVRVAFQRPRRPVEPPSRAEEEPEQQ